jgi:hypothetical protein
MLKLARLREMTRRAVADWSAILKKGVKSKDEEQVGTVVGTSEDKVVFERGSRFIYRVPKTEVQGFDGNEIFLNLSKEELNRYEERV